MNFVVAVVVFITPVGSRPGATAGPAALTLQSGLAQESVIVRGSARSLPGDAGHGVSRHSGAHDNTDYYVPAVPKPNPLESGIGADKLQAKSSNGAILFITSFARESSCRLDTQIYFSLSPHGLCHDQIHSTVKPFPMTIKPSDICCCSTLCSSALSSPTN